MAGYDDIIPGEWLWMNENLPGFCNKMVEIGDSVFACCISLVCVTLPMNITTMYSVLLSTCAMLKLHNFSETLNSQTYFCRFFTFFIKLI